MKRLASTISVAIALVLVVVASAGAQEFFKTVEEDIAHWQKCMARTGTVYVQIGSKQAPAGTLMNRWKVEDETKTTVYVTTQAHVVTNKAKSAPGQAPQLYDRIWVEFVPGIENFEAELVSIDRTLDLALLKATVPKTPPPSHAKSPYDYRQLMDRIVPVRDDDQVVANFKSNWGSLAWFVGYSGGQWPQRMRARFIGSVAAGIDFPQVPTGGLYLFTFEHLPAISGVSGGYFLDWSCEVVIGALYHATGEIGEAATAHPAHIVKKFVEEGLRKEGIALP